MKNKVMKPVLAITILALALFPTLVLGQEKNPPEAPEPEHGYIDFGARGFWGDVYGRPDLGFEPPLRYSKFEEYRDIRNAPFVRSARLNLENVLGSKNYFHLLTAKSFFRDQSVLATFGRYDWYKIQLRYDEIPHTFSDTTRTLYTSSAPGVMAFPAAVRTALETFPNSSTNLPSFIQTTVLATGSEGLIIPNLLRKGGTGLFSWNPTPDWNLNFSYFREHQTGARPIGLIFNSSPSASLSAGYGVEVPEPIDYNNNLIRFGTEYGRGQWGFQLNFIGSYFENNINTLVFDNPFRTTDCVNVGCGAFPLPSPGPAVGRMDLYPDNQAQYINIAGAFDITKYVRFMASITPGWLRQNDPFVPYTTNTLLNTCGATSNVSCSSPASLPGQSLHGYKQTLAMNYTFVTNLAKNVEIKATYRHYDYNNNTPILTFTPVQGDIAAPSPGSTEENTPFAYNRKNLEVAGNWFFAKNSSLKIGYEGEWMDRSHRDVAHSKENGVVAALDFTPIKPLLFRVSYRHADRTPDAYEDDEFTDISGGITGDQIFSRRFDEAARVRDRADGLIQYNPTDRLGFSVFASTTQDDYNRPGGTNSPTPLFVVPGATVTPLPYYLYGVLKDFSYNYGFDADYAVMKQLSLFAEYSHEKYHKRMVSRYRTPESFSGSSGCGPNSLAQANRGPCDTPNNDWMSTSREFVDIWAVGADTYPTKKASLSVYYTLSAGKGHVDSTFAGDPVAHPFTPPANDPFRFVLVGTNAAVDYPETVSRSHEVAAVFKYRINRSFTPRLEYRYQQFDNHDYQTSAMTPYMGCVSSPPPAVPVPNCTTPILDSSTSQTPNATPNPVFPNLYPFFVVGDPSAARYLFLGTDQPSYRVHYFAATLEWHF